MREFSLVRSFPEDGLVYQGDEVKPGVVRGRPTVAKSAHLSVNQLRTPDRGYCQPGPRAGPRAGRCPCRRRTRGLVER